MESFFIHLLKSSGILLLFLVSYYTFLKKETFFESNRFFLGAGLLASLLLPFFTITKTVYVERAPMTFSNLVELTTPAQIETPETFNWLGILLLTYLTGVILFTFRLLLQLRAINQIKKKSAVVKENEFYHVKTSTKISPFSFFKHIFYYPFQFNQEELQTILIHEKEHAKGLHSVDILFTEIVCILQWFNPIIYIYKIMVKQNLEFLADSKTCAQFENKKQYQYLMLKQVVGHQKITIANPFFNSLIKKRIVMLNQNQSKQIKILKVLAILPLLAVFLFSFNTKEVIKSVSSAPISTLSNEAAFMVTKNTTNEELLAIKEKLAKDEIDFSYTSVRNEKKEIVDLELHAFGQDLNKVDFNIAYNTNTEKPIDDLLIRFDKKIRQFFIGKKSKKELLLKPKGRKGQKISGEIKTNPQPLGQEFSAEITQIKIEVDKDSQAETFEQDSKFLKEKNIQLDFKRIKRNSSGEITAIKVVYDNGSGDKGSYQQQKTKAIIPFEVRINFLPNEPASINISEIEDTKENNKMVFIRSDGKNEVIHLNSTKNSSNIWVEKENTVKGKILEINTNDSKEIIILDGKELTLDELESEGEIEKFISKSISKLQIVNDSTGKTTIENITMDHNDGKEESISLIDSDENTLKYVIVKKPSTTSKKGMKIHLNDEDSEHEDTMIFLGSEESDTVSGKVEIKTMGKNPLYIIDGKEVSKKEFKKLEPDDIATVNVYKGDKSFEKFGKKAKNGVVEVVTKPKKQ